MPIPTAWRFFQKKERVICTPKVRHFWRCISGFSLFLFYGYALPPLVNAGEKIRILTKMTIAMTRTQNYDLAKFRLLMLSLLSAKMMSAIRPTKGIVNKI